MRTNIIFFALSILIGCKNKELNTSKSFVNQEDSIKTVTNSNYNFDSLLKCSYFSDNGDYFVTADHGCVYGNENGNELGNIFIYLIPIENHIYNEDVVNSLNIEQMKEFFKILVFIIPKEFLVDTPEGFYQKNKYIEKLYIFNVTSKKWDLIDMINIISSKNGNLVELKWREDIISKNIKKPQINQNWVGNFEGTFNRIEGEGDPRAWGMVNLKVSKENISFKLVTYAEDADFLLKLIEQTDEELTLKYSDYTFVLNKKNNMYTLNTNYIDEIMKKKVPIEMEKQ